MNTCAATESELAHRGAPVASAAVIAAWREASVGGTQLQNSLAEHLGLRASEVIALNYIDLCGDLQPRELAKNVALTSGGVTGMIDRLERAGYICRHRHPTDRRGILLSPTTQGRLAIAWYYQHYLSGLADLLNRTVVGEGLADLLLGPGGPSPLQSVSTPTAVR